MSLGRILSSLFICALVVASVVFSANNLPAGLRNDVSSLEVEADGIRFGSFDRIDGLKELLRSSSPDKSPLTPQRLSFQRNFVTDVSLYQWAKQVVDNREGPKEISLVKRSSEGDVIARYSLKLCQPLEWSVEAANPALGGFHEKVDIAVERVEIY